jgi:hypothetical protein
MARTVNLMRRPEADIEVRWAGPLMHRRGVPRLRSIYRVYTTVCVFPEGSTYFTVTGMNRASVACDGPVVTAQVTFGVARYFWQVGRGS